MKSTPLLRAGIVPPLFRLHSHAQMAGLLQLSFNELITPFVDSEDWLLGRISDRELLGRIHSDCADVQSTASTLIRDRAAQLLTPLTLSDLEYLDDAIRRLGNGKT